MKHVIILPDLGQTTSEARIVSWLKNSGDKVAMGEALLEVETDKATMYLEAYVGGYLRRCRAVCVAAGAPRHGGVYWSGEQAVAGYGCSYLKQQIFDSSFLCHGGSRRLGCRSMAVSLE